jgi:hypothetical protein
MESGGEKVKLESLTEKSRLISKKSAHELLLSRKNRAFEAKFTAACRCNSEEFFNRL